MRRARRPWRPSRPQSPAPSDPTEPSRESAINDVLHHAIAFTPTVVTVHKARVVGGRIYILLLIADEEGEKTMETFSTTEPRTE